MVNSDLRVYSVAPGGSVCMICGSPMALICPRCGEMFRITRGQPREITETGLERLDHKTTLELDAEYKELMAMAAEELDGDEDLATDEESEQ